MLDKRDMQKLDVKRLAKKTTGVEKITVKMTDFKKSTMKRAINSSTSEEENAKVKIKKVRKSWRLPSNPEEDTKSRHGWKRRILSDSSDDETVSIKSKKKLCRKLSSSEEKSRDGRSTSDQSNSSDRSTSDGRKTCDGKNSSARWNTNDQKNIRDERKSHDGNNTSGGRKKSENVQEAAERRWTSSASTPCLRDEVSCNIQGLTFYHLLGQGAFGKVLLADNSHTNELFAVKIMSKRHLLRCGVEIAFMERNILELASGSAFLVHGHFAHQTPEHILFGMEYVSGRDLEHLLMRNWPLNISSARFYCAEIVCGLQFLHSKGYAHGDLKPNNIMVAATGHLKITDFGLAIDITPRDRSATGCAGSGGAVTPGVRFGRRRISEDWFSVGLILQQMILRTSYEPGSAILDIIAVLIGIRPAKCRPGVNYNIRHHDFFQHIDWVAMEALEIEPPYLPAPPTSPCSASTCDQLEVMEAEEARHQPLTAAEQDLFAGFSFTTTTQRTLPEAPGLRPSS